MIKFVMFGLGFLVSGCVSTSAFVRLHEAAIKSESKKICYRISEPEEIAGRYCLTFDETKFKKEKYILVND
jgi:hypothetical protein